MSDNRTTRLTAWTSAAAITLVALTPMVLSATSLAAWARDSLGLTGLLPWLVPASLDVAALATIALALHATLRGESGGAPKALAWCLVAGSAVANHRHGQAVGTQDAEVYYPALPILSMVLIELGLRFARRSALIAAGRTEASLPHWRLVRWVRFPSETFAAWSLALGDGITSPAEAVARVRSERTTAVGALSGAAGGDVAPETAATAELAAMSKADRLRAAFAAVGEVDVRKASAWLARQGVEAPAPRYCYEVAAAERERTPELRAIEGVSA